MTSLFRFGVRLNVLNATVRTWTHKRDTVTFYVAIRTAKMRLCCAADVYNLNLFLDWIGGYISAFIVAMQFVRNVGHHFCFMVLLCACAYFSHLYGADFFCRPLIEFHKHKFPLEWCIFVDTIFLWKE